MRSVFAPRAQTELILFKFYKHIQDGYTSKRNSQIDPSSNLGGELTPKNQ